MSKLNKEEIRNLRKDDVITLDGFAGEQVVDKIGLWAGGGYLCLRGVKDGIALSKVHTLNAVLSSRAPRNLNYC